MKAKSKIGILSLSIATLLFMFLLAPAWAKPIPARRLMQYPHFYDGEIIEYRGEVIGDIMQRGEYAWINVKDGNYVIGVWILSSLVKQIRHTGKYNAQGDIVKVKGRFHQDCPTHNANLDIHAESLVIESKGSILDQPLAEKKIRTVLYLGALALC